MIIRMSHVGVAVKDLEKTLKLYEDVLGLHPEAVKDMGRSKLAFIPVGDDEIELIQPSDVDVRWCTTSPWRPTTSRPPWNT
jgi:methylmalonyl-CoA/ethylmalonyl-CoA epimerase